MRWQVQLGINGTSDFFEIFVKIERTVEAIEFCPIQQNL